VTAGSLVDPAVLHGAVWAALGEVVDPELDEPVTALGFVAACRVEDDGTVRVRLRLPTYFCAPNFAFLMVADARDAVLRVPGVRRADVALDEHFAAEAINAGVADGRGFVGTFGDLAADELDELRRDFLRKAVLAATDRACRELSADGSGPERWTTLTLGEVAHLPAVRRLRDRRASLGLPAGDGDPLIVDPESGAGVEAAALALHLRRARLTRVSVEANGDVCRGLLHGRYPETLVSINPGGTPTHAPAPV
jgi:metal-sulfur cluster biosynthetic enzyme